MSDLVEKRQGRAAGAPVKQQPAREGTSRVRQPDQERARYAWRCVEEVPEPQSKLGKRYGTLARKLPSYLQVSGLGQTFAFLFSRGKEGKAEALLLKQLGQHLREVVHRSSTQSPMDVVLSLTAAEYRQATREMMALAEWLKRFAEGKLGEEDA